LGRARFGEILQPLSKLPGFSASRKTPADPLDETNLREQLTLHRSGKYLVNISAAGA
jgi:hypothetical protein